MDSNRKTAIIVGVLFIIATVFLFIGEAFYGPILESPDYLEIAYPNRIRAILGVLMEFACVLAIPLIPIVLYPVLRKYNEALALGYFGFRFLEAVLFVLVQINTLSLISASQNYLGSAGTAASYWQNAGSAAQSWNLWAFYFYIFFFTIGALLFYSALYQSRLVPRFLSIWGLIAAALLLAGTTLEIVEAFSGIPAGMRELGYAAPIAVNEMVLALWLIVKGFNPTALAAAEEQEQEKALVGLA